nr:AMP-binding protein [Neptunicella marina]
MVDASLDAPKRAKLCDAYQPNWIVDEYGLHKQHAAQHLLDERVAVLLSTSGSTGSPKQVALSVENLQANAQGIASGLPIAQSDITITTLSMAYSYGLSVINSHLQCGASILLNEHSVMSREFWQALEQHKVSSFAGVPYSYEMLIRLGLCKKKLADLRYFTQAGGKLAKKYVQQLADFANAQNKQFFVMYGQTEATARMAINAEPEHYPESIGYAIEGGAFLLIDEQGHSISQNHIEGQLVYQGPNVMLGYAQSVVDLAHFEPASQLVTGDLAYRDEQGRYFISGRQARFIKPFGNRISLDDVEIWLQQQGVDGLATGDNDELWVGVCESSHLELTDLKNKLQQQLNLHPSKIKIFSIDAIPLTSSGKTDYPAFKQLISEVSG